MLLLTLLASVNVFATTMGDELKLPEDGWKRFDNNDSAFIYLGDNWREATDSVWYNDTLKYTFEYKRGTKIKFKFYGTKLRLVQTRGSKYSSNTLITIDGGNPEKLDCYTSEYEYKRQRLVYEKSSLSLGVHYVEMNCGDDRIYGLENDAVDLDEDGYLIPYYQPTNLKAIQVDNLVDLSWDTIDSATGYIIKRSETAGGPYNQIATTTTSSISYSDNTIEHNKTYYYVVSAIVSGIEKEISKEASVSTAISNKLSLVLEINTEKQLSVTTNLSDNQDMIWTSSNISVTTVDNTGKLKTLKSGNVVITCTNSDGSYTETINVLVVDLQLQLAVDLSVNEKCKLLVGDINFTVIPVWKANDSTIAMVSSTGNVTAIGQGLTFITAVDETGKEIGRIYIRVK